MKTSFPMAHLKAVAHFMPKNDIRYYVNGVCLEVLAGETRLIATDGHAVGATRYKVDNSADFGQIIIPATVVEIVVKMKHALVVVDFVDGMLTVAGMMSKPEEGKFPDYRRVIPAHCSGEAAGFNPDLMCRFAKAGKALGLKGNPIVRQNGKDAALVQFYNFDEFAGVIMPYAHFSEKHPDLGVPSWVNTRLA